MKKIFLLFFLMILVAVSIVNAHTISKTKLYNFNDTYENFTMNAFAGSGKNLSSNSTPLDVNTVITSRHELDSSDNDRVDTSAQEGTYATQIFKACTNEMEEDVNITSMNWTWEGYTQTASYTTKFYVWNLTTNNYTLFYNLSTSTERTYMYNFSEPYKLTNMTNCSYFAVQGTCKWCYSVTTDFVSLNVNYIDFLDTNLSTNINYYNTNQVSIRINTSDPYNDTIFIEKSNTNRRFNTTLCQNCTNWTGTVSFAEGEQIVRVYANDSSNNLVMEEYSLGFYNKTVFFANESGGMDKYCWESNTCFNESHLHMQTSYLANGKNLYLYFNISNITNYYSIYEANLSMYCYNADTTARTHIIYRITSDWNETDNSIPNKDYTENTSLLFNAEKRWYIFNVKDWTQKIINTTNNNYGFFVNDTKQGSTETADYYSSEQTTASNMTPRLNITFTQGFPNITVPTIIPSGTLYSNNTLNCSAIPGDNFNTSILVNFKWFNNTVEVANLARNVTCTRGENCNTSQFYNESHHFNNITCQVQSFDGTYWSDPENSTTVYINNSKPTVASASLNNSVFNDDDDLACLNGSITDIDYYNKTDDIPKLHYDWSKNGAWQNINSSNLSASLTTTDDVFYCRLLVGDSYENSSWVTSEAVIIGSSARAPGINWTNASVANTGVNISFLNPINNNTYANITVEFYDNNTIDTHTVYFCKTNSFAGTNCTSTTYCSGLSNISGVSQSCSYNISGIEESTLDGYAFILDNTSLFTAGYLYTININHFPETQTNIYPQNNSFINHNSTWVNFTATDRDGDLINYTLYAGDNVNSLQVINLSTTGYYNFSQLNDSTYYWRFTTKDQHNYNSSINTTLQQFTVDWTSPNVTISSPVQSTTYYSKTVTLTQIAADSYLNTCVYNVVQTSIGATDIANTSVGCGSTTSFTVSAYTDYTLNFYATDKAGNRNLTSVNFTTATTPESPSGGGGGGEPDVIYITEEIVKKKCVVTVVPQSLEFDVNNRLKKVDITNYENESITPIYKIPRSDLISLPGFTKQVIQPKQTVELAIQYNRNYNLTDDVSTSVTLETTNCVNIVIPILVKPFKGLSLENIKGDDLFDTLRNVVTLSKNELLNTVMEIPYNSNKSQFKLKFYYLLITVGVLTGAGIYFATRRANIGFFSKALLWGIITFFLTLATKYIILVVSIEA